MRIWAFPSFYPIDLPGKNNNGIFAHRQYKGLQHYDVELKVIQPIPWTPIFPFYYLHSHWLQFAKLNYPLQREYDGVKVYHPRWPNMKPYSLFKVTYETSYVKAVVQFFKTNNIKLDPATDIFYSQWLPESLLVQRAARILGIKSAVLAIGDDILILPQKSEANLDQFRETWEGADLRMAVAKNLAEEGNRQLGKKLAYHVVRRGVEYNLFKPVSPAEKREIRTEYKFPQDKIVVLCVGTAIVLKGWVDLLDALEKLKGVNPNFVLVGIYSGHSNVNLPEEVAKRSLNDQFIDMGSIAPGEMARIYAAADIFCLPSHSEGIANAVAEAMSTGIPVVTTNVGGHPELITNGVNGIMIPPKQPQLIFENLLALVNDPEMRKEIGNRARNFMVNEWGSFADNAKKLYQIFEDCLESGKKK